MNNLVRNKRKLYWCSRKQNVDYEEYNEPIETRFNFRELGQEAIIENTGSIANTYLIIKDINSKIEMINVGDRFYASMPTNFDSLANDADYTVSKKIIGLDFGELVLESMINRW